MWAVLQLLFSIFIMMEKSDDKKCFTQKKKKSILVPNQMTKTIALPVVAWSFFFSLFLARGNNSDDCKYLYIPNAIYYVCKHLSAWNELNELNAIRHSSLLFLLTQIKMIGGKKSFWLHMFTNKCFHFYTRFKLELCVVSIILFFTSQLIELSLITEMANNNNEHTRGELI